MPKLREPTPCTLESCGYYFEGDDAKRITDVVNHYLSVFLTPGDCIFCGRSLGGIMGTFTWALTHGEGHCGNCLWPARGIHRILDTDGEPIFNSPPRWILQYAPDSLADEFFDHLIRIQHFQEDIDRIKELCRLKIVS